MKVLVWILLGLIGCIIVLSLLSLLIFGWYDKAVNNPEPSNKHITFVGNDKKLYDNCTSSQNADGSIIIASVLSRYRTPLNQISLIKLSPIGKFMWEKKISFARFTFWDLIPGILRGGKGRQDLNLLGINFVDGKYYLLLNRFNLKVNEPYILTFDAKGKLSNTTKIKLEMEKTAPAKSIMQKNFAYLGYQDLPSKLLCLAKLDIKTGNVINNSMLFYKQDSLSIYTIAADQADTTVSMTAYDGKNGCSYYMYTKSAELQEYFRTKPSSQFTVLKYIGARLYGVVKDDSLLQIVDLTSLSKPLIVVSDTPPDKNFRAKDLQLINGNFYVTIDVINPKAKEYGVDVIVRRYTPNREKPREYLIRGRGSETSFRLFATADKQLIVLGNSTSTKLERSMKVFASKFPL